MQLNHLSCRLGLGAMILAGTQIAIAETLKELDRKSGGGLFARMWRTSACEDVQNPSYPSIVRMPSGDLLLMFTHEPTGNAELAVPRSEDDGKTWSPPQTVYTSTRSVPKAMGTLTRLNSGPLLAPFVDGDQLRILVSKDSGKTWSPSRAIDASPLRNASTHGRIVELSGELLMPVFCKMRLAGGDAACSGLLRSTDGGTTWGNFTVIACDRKEAKIDYGPTAVHAGADGQILALISVADEYLYRSVSTDRGKTWSVPQQRMTASNPALAAVGSTLVSVNGVGRHIRVQFSENLFDSWCGTRWLDWNIGGQYASVLALDEDRLLLVHDRGNFNPDPKHRGTVATEGIEVAMMQRNPGAPPFRKSIIPEEKRDQWELVRTLDKTFPNELESPLLTKTPDGKLLAATHQGLFLSPDSGKSFERIGPLPELVATEPGQKWSGNSDPVRVRLTILGMVRGGRILLACSDTSELDSKAWSGTYALVGREDGYDRWKLTGVHGVFRIRIFYTTIGERLGMAASRST